MKNNTKIVMLCVDTIVKMAAAVSLLLLKIGLFVKNKRCSIWEKMHFTWFFQERWVFPHSSPNPASPLRGSGQDIYGELMGENSISPGKPCEMHIIQHASGMLVKIIWMISIFLETNKCFLS